MTDLKTLFDAARSIEMPAPMPDKLSDNKIYWDEYAHKPYIDNRVPIVDYGLLKTETEYVDLGLPSGILWATCNVGAKSKTDYGDYYAWGETEVKSDYSWDTYKWANGDYNKLTKYCPANETDYWDGEGEPDDKAVLDLEDDVASVKLDDDWRIPTDAEWTELIENCTWTWTNQNGVKGYKVTGSNGNSMFLPAAGYLDGTNLYLVGSYGYYWSSSLDTDNPDKAWGVYFYSSTVYRDNNSRCDGHSVRLVVNK